MHITLVFYKKFYITGSVIGAVDLNFSTEEQTGGNHKKVSVIPSGVYKGGIGYNSDTWSIGASIAGDAYMSEVPHLLKNILCLQEIFVLFSQKKLA